MYIYVEYVCICMLYSTRVEYICMYVEGDLQEEVQCTLHT